MLWVVAAERPLCLVVASLLCLPPAAGFVGGERAGGRPSAGARRPVRLPHGSPALASLSTCHVHASRLHGLTYTSFPCVACVGGASLRPAYRGYAHGSMVVSCCLV